MAIHGGAGGSTVFVLGMSSRLVAHTLSRIPALEAPALKAADDVIETWQTATPIAGFARIGINDDLRDLDGRSAGD